MDFQFIPIDYSYFDFNGRNYVKIFGKSASGKRICLVDDYSPNFWLILKEGVSEKEIETLISHIESIEVGKADRKSKIEKIEIKEKNYLGKRVNAINVFVTNHKDLHDVATEIGESEIIESRREYDINILSKYIIHSGFEPLKWYNVNADLISGDEYGALASNLNVDLCLHLNTFKETEDKPFHPKVFAYDIETDDILGKGKILMISVYGTDYQRVFTLKKTKNQPSYVQKYDNEAEMIEGFVDAIKKETPDAICGYFSDGFDLPYLKERAKELKIPLNLGLDDSEPTFSKGRINSGKIEGIVHLDLYRFVNSVFYQYLQSESLKLDDVAYELLGERKEEFDLSKIKNLTEDDWNNFFSYNLKDSELTYKLFKKLWPDFLEFSRIVREPLFKICRDGMSTHVENYILHQLKNFDEIAEKKPTNDNISERRGLGKYEGAFVYEPKPGLYEDIVMFDFTSMYSSVIISYNLSKSTYEGLDDNGLPYFTNKKGFFPIMLEEIIEKRKKYKREYAKNKNNLTKARSNAYKLLANASYGYLGFFGARYYSRESAATTTRLAKENILKAIKKIEKKGYTILYSDTDSIAFIRGKDSKQKIKEYLEELNEGLQGIMELDLENYYDRGLFVSTRSGESGAKKKYALLMEDGNLKIRGFETVRRDWCILARDLQSKILKLILTEGNETKALALLERTIQTLKSGEVQIEKLILKNQLKKSIDSYLSKGPHVAAAEKMKEKGIPIYEGLVIEYFIGEISEKSKKISDKVFLPDEEAKYDYDYYLNNQIIPVVENIFAVFGVDVNELVRDKKQKSLGDY